jgi:hypothetical protein
MALPVDRANRSGSGTIIDVRLYKNVMKNLSPSLDQWRL